MMTTRSKTKRARINAIEYGHYILEELARATMTDVDHMSHLLMEIMSTQALWWRVMYEIDFRNKVRAHCETFVTALKSERDLNTIEVWLTATKTELLKHRANIILKDLAKY